MDRLNRIVTQESLKGSFFLKADESRFEENSFWEGEKGEELLRTAKIKEPQIVSSPD